MAIRQKCPEKRKSLLNATLNLVNNNGFHDAPMSKIAKTANVSPATIYIYFKNKQDLVDQLYLEVKKHFSEYAFKNYNEDLGIEDGFKLIWHNIAQFKLEQVEEANFLSACDNTPIINDEIRKLGVELLNPLKLLWEKGIKDNILKNLSPFTMYAFTIYPLAFLLQCHQKKQCELNSEKMDRAYKAAWDSIKL
ncbi:transcriptional regulator, TetR family [Lutibacter oricola]|uniref:Transcriptional regulator, TetR family n=1 Tax=Lutibacter oricola TaxID=762486 RepID=A0A1H2RFY8_9FLAO|nr:TetR/AcrR family transcriptional regulator [Lutibacter oricola]SDW18080.1 transcriptional regulator, TetR family [Lutibacter oricola]